MWYNIVNYIWRNLSEIFRCIVTLRVWYQPCCLVQTFSVQKDMAESIVWCVCSGWSSFNGVFWCSWWSVQLCQWRGMQLVGHVQRPQLQVQSQTHHLPRLKLRAIITMQMRVGNVWFIRIPFVNQVPRPSYVFDFFAKKEKRKEKRVSDVFDSSFENLHNVRDQAIFGTCLILIGHEDAYCHPSLMSMSWFDCNVSTMFGNGHVLSCHWLLEVGTWYLYLVVIVAQW